MDTFSEHAYSRVCELRPEPVKRARAISYAHYPTICVHYRPSANPVPTKFTNICVSITRLR